MGHPKFRIVRKGRATRHLDFVLRESRMNWDKVVKNVNRRVELQPPACFLDPQGREMPEISDDWLIAGATDDRLTITNTRTQHQTVLAKDHVHHFTSNLIRSPDGSDHGFLVLQIQIFIQGQIVRIRPCIRPGERLAPTAVLQISDKWVDMTYPSQANLSQKLGCDPQALAWCRQSRVAGLVAQGVAEVILEPDGAGRANRLHFRDSPEPQTLVRRLPPKQ